MRIFRLPLQDLRRLELFEWLGMLLFPLRYKQYAVLLWVGNKKRRRSKGGVLGPAPREDRNLIGRLGGLMFWKAFSVYNRSECSEEAP